MQYIHRIEWLAYGFLVVAALAVSLPLFPYRWHTFLHIAGAVVFLGNIIITAAWMLMAERTRNVHVIHFSAKAVIRADLLFTLPGVLLVLMNGFAMVFDRWGGRDAIYPLSWISAALWLFTASGVVYGWDFLSPPNIAWLCSLTRWTTRTRYHQNSPQRSASGTFGGRLQ